MAIGGTAGLRSAATRRAVRAERTEVVRWRRLLRARLDLLVASYAPPSPLGSAGWDVLPETAVVPPATAELEAALGDCSEPDRVAAMLRLRDLDRRLGSYADELDRLLEASTEDLVMHLVDHELTELGIVD